MANNYKDFSLEDFINDPFFQDWVISPDEKKNNFWNKFIGDHPDKSETIEKAVTLLQSIGFKEEWPEDATVERSLMEALAKGSTSPGRVVELYDAPSKVKPFYQKWWAAAAVLLFLVSGIWYLVMRDNVDKPIAITPKVEDIAPGGNKAILTLADGTQMVLDTTNNGAITKQGNVTVIKLNGQLAYQPSTVNDQPSTVQYNTINTPRGGQYQLILADGSKVWLNAASSLRFPSAFTGNQRNVELTGEAYFEVAHNKEKAFTVQLIGGAEIQVLGTHFNVNSYADEEALQTTLLEGSVQVSKNAQKLLLKPGQQANVRGNNLTLIKSANLDEVMAWKNGYFTFHNAGLQTNMRQISRWYDVDVVYAGAVPQVQFSGELGRSLNLTQVLSALTEMGISYKIENKKLTIMP